MRTSIVIWSVAACVLLFLSRGMVQAQDFEVSPVRIDFSAEPSQSQTRVLTVKNHGNKKSSYIVSMSDFIPSSDGHREKLAPNTSKRSCANWLNINPSFFDLNPGEEMQVQVTILVPSNEMGAAWCMLNVEPVVEQTAWSVDNKMAAGVTVSGRIGVLVFQTPKSNAVESIKVTGMAELPSLDESKRTFAVTIDNLGERVTPCKVFLIASNMATGDEKQFEAVEIETFPKMSRVCTLEFPVDSLAAGQYALAAIADYGPRYPLEGTQIIIDILPVVGAQPDSVRTVKP